MPKTAGSFEILKAGFRIVEIAENGIHDTISIQKATLTLGQDISSVPLSKLSL